MSILALSLLAVATLGILALLAAVLRAAIGPRAAPIVAPLPEEELASEAGVEDCLAALIRHPTVSSYEPEREDDAAFEALIAELPRLFPRVHAGLSRERVGSRGLLYTWTGADPALPPAILLAHFDVVPAEDASAWRYPPFSGAIAEGAVWGRGAQDIKPCLASLLFSAEALLGQGFRPRRNLYFAFGGDEETDGLRGARAIAAELARRGVRASFILDEGGPVAVGMLPMADRPLALVGIAEKGYLDLLLEARGSGGHASMPPRRSAVGDLARAIAALEACPSPARLGFTLRNFLGRLSPYVPFAYRLLFRNLALSGALVKAAFAASPTTNALIRTTAAPTMLAGSPKENVLADSASALINVRILPGESSAEVLDRVGRLVGRYGVTVRAAHPADVSEALPESPVDHEGYRSIEKALAASFPEAATVPFLFSATTDSKHYRNLAEAIYRLTPLAQTSEDLAGIHGRDERVGIGNLRRCARFYRRLLEQL